MRTTKIFFRRFRIINAFFLGGACAAVLCVPVFAAITLVNQPAAVSALPEPVSQTSASPLDDLGALRIAGYIRTPDGVSYVFSDADGRRIRDSDLVGQSITITDQGPRQALLTSGPHSLTVYR